MGTVMLALSTQPQLSNATETLGKRKYLREVTERAVTF